MNNETDLGTKLRILRDRMDKLVAQLSIIDGIVYGDPQDPESFYSEFAALERDIIATQRQVGEESRFQDCITLFKKLAPSAASPDMRTIVIGGHFVLWRIDIEASRLWFARAAHGALCGPTQSVFRISEEIFRHLPGSDFVQSLADDTAALKHNWRALIETRVSKVATEDIFVGSANIWEVRITGVAPFFVAVGNSGVASHQRFESLADVLIACQCWEQLDLGFRPGPPEPLPYWKRRGIDPDDGLDKLLADCEIL